MKQKEITGLIKEQIQMARNETTDHSIIYKSEDHTGRHEFLFFIKPEITLEDENVRLERILEMMLDKIGKFKFHIADIRILTAKYLEKYNIIARHYGVINALSRNPREQLSSEAFEKFTSAFGLNVSDAKILGSLEFLRQYPSYDPESLNELWQKSQGIKLSGGAYCAQVKIHDETIYLINGFHPKQLEHFTAKGRSIVAFTLTSDIDWKIARNEFIGKTNPAEASEGSLRNELLVRHEWFGLTAVSSSKNGFHLSAGPVEGLVELQRYCSDFSKGDLKKPGDYHFGRQLAENFNPEQISRILHNTLVHHNGKKISIFDLTEEKNSDEAVVLLKECIF